jgi:hypothetical protein
VSARPKRCHSVRNSWQKSVCMLIDRYRIEVVVVDVIKRRDAARRSNHIISHPRTRNVIA